MTNQWLTYNGINATQRRTIATTTKRKQAQLEALETAKTDYYESLTVVDVIIQRTAIGWYNVHSESATFNIDPATMLEHFAAEGFTRKLYRATIEISKERFESLGGVLR